MEVFQKRDTHTLEVQGQRIVSYTVRQLIEKKRLINERKLFAITRFDSEIAEVDALLVQCSEMGILENLDEAVADSRLGRINLNR